MLVDALEKAGVNRTFGIPGYHNLAIFDALTHSTTIKHVCTRHEQGAGFAASGFARATGRPAAVLTITGPGVLNAMAAMGSCMHDSIPMILISSQAPSNVKDVPQHGFLHHLRNSSQATGTVSKKVIQVFRPEDIPSAVEEAVRVSTEGRPGPVHLEVPMDILDGLAPPCGPLPSHPPMAPFVDGSLIARAAEVLSSAKNPRILVGGGAAGASKEVRQLAEWLGAPVITTIAGKGVLDERHPLSLGGRIHIEHARKFMQEGDAVLAVGTQFSPTDWNMGNAVTLDYFPGSKIVHIDIDRANFLHHTDGDVGIPADAKLACTQLLALLESKTQPVRTGVAAAVAKVRTEADTTEHMGEISGCTHGARPWERTLYPLMDHCINKLRAALPENGIFYSEPTRPGYLAFSSWPCYEPGTFQHPIGFGEIGFAMPAAIGGKLARPDVPVLALCGDGGAQFTVNEMSVLAETGASLLWVVWNDEGYGEIRRCQETAFSTDVQPLSFKKLADVYGIQAESVGSAAEFDAALAAPHIQAALLGKGPPAILEVRVCEAILKPVPAKSDSAEVAPAPAAESNCVPGARSTVSSVPPYKYGRSIEEVTRELGLTNVVKLNSNENNYSPFKVVTDALEKTQWGGNFGLYPDHTLFQLKDRLAEVYGLSPERVGIHAGAWSALRLVATAFLEPGTRALTSSISYALYQSLTEITGAKIDIVDSDEVTLATNLERMAEAITPDTRIVWLCNPNNPTGTGFSTGELERLLDVLDERTNGQGWVVLDEAYYGFAPPKPLADGVKLSETRNVICIRSMSKLFGLAGLRIGFVMGPPSAVSLLDHLSDPFTNSRPALAGALAAVSPEGIEASSESVKFIAADRARIERELNAMDGAGCPCAPSASNFVMIETPGVKSGKLAEALLEQSGLIIRPCDAWWGLTHHSRVTVGTTEQTDRFLDGMQKVLSDKSILDRTGDNIGSFY